MAEKLKIYEAQYAQHEQDLNGLLEEEADFEDLANGSEPQVFEKSVVTAPPPPPEDDGEKGNERGDGSGGGAKHDSKEDRSNQGNEATKTVPIKIL